MNKIIVDKKAVPAGKIICVGRNYTEHIKELGNEIPENMVLFLKPESAITNILRFEQNGDSLHYEGEISFLFNNGKFSAVAFGLDLTKRELQTKLKKKGLPWERAKAFDGSLLFSEFVKFNCNFSELYLNLFINNKKIQSAGVESMIYKPDQILKEILSFMTLNDGDIVMTGTPAGVGVICRGDTFHGEIKGLKSTLTNISWIAE